MWEKHRSAASCRALSGDLAHNPGTCPTGNPTGNLSVCGVTPNPKIHASQGYLHLFRWKSPDSLNLGKGLFTPMSWWPYIVLMARTMKRHKANKLCVLKELIFNLAHTLMVHSFNIDNWGSALLRKRKPKKRQNFTNS